MRGLKTANLKAAENGELNSAPSAPFPPASAFLFRKVARDRSKAEFSARAREREARDGLCTG